MFVLYLDVDSYIVHMNVYNFIVIVITVTSIFTQIEHMVFFFSHG